MTVGRMFCLLVAALCMAALGYAASYWYPLPQPGTQPTDIATPEPVENPTRIEAMGRIEPVSGTLTVAAIPGEEIVQLNVHVGQTVKKDVVLAVLGSQKLRSEERILAEQQLEKAQQQFEAEQALARLRQDVALISQQQAAAREKEIPTEESIRVGEERQALAVAQLERLEQLRQAPQTQDAIAEAELEQQRLLIKQIQVDMDHNRAQLEAAHADPGVRPARCGLGCRDGQADPGEPRQGQSAAGAGTDRQAGPPGGRSVARASTLRWHHTRGLRPAG